MKKWIFLLLTWLGNASAQGVPNVSTRIAPDNWVLSGDLLIWYASEQPSGSWANDVIAGFNGARQAFVDTFAPVPLFFKWDYGVRLGMGYNIPYDRWDTQFYWSWFRTQANGSVERGAIFTEFFGGFANDDLAVSGRLRWNLSYNMFDWELGRNFWVSRSLAIRPFVGIKGGWIDQKIHSQWHVISSNGDTVNFGTTEDLKNNFWGIGPSSGVNTKWALDYCNNFNLFGDFSTAMMWGFWRFKDVYNNPTPLTKHVTLNNSQLGALMLRGFMGFGWDVDFNQGMSHFSAKAGYEMQFWLNQLRMPTFGVLPLHGDLTLQGISIDCRFDF